MKLLVISYGRLVLNGTAGQTVMCGLVQAALKRNFNVSFLGLNELGVCNRDEVAFEATNGGGQLIQDNVLYERVNTNKIQRFLGNFDLGRIQKLTQRSRLLDCSYDALIAFESLAIQVAQAVQAGSKFYILGDPVGERLQSHPNTLSWREGLIASLIARTEAPYFRRLIPRDVSIGMFGTRHAREWSKKLGRIVIDLRPMFPTYAVEKTDDHNRRPYGKLRAIFGGSLSGTASRAALPVIENRVLPALRRNLGAGFEFCIVGEASEEFRLLAERNFEVRLFGRVPNFETTLSSAHIFFLPMRYPVGVRTRLCAALASGCYAICDSSIRGNMPELDSCAAVKFADTLNEMTDAIAEYISSPKSSQFNDTARAFFHEHYRAEIAAQPILNRIAE